MSLLGIAGGPKKNPINSVGGSVCHHFSAVSGMGSHGSLIQGWVRCGEALYPDNGIS